MCVRSTINKYQRGKMLQFSREVNCAEKAKQLDTSATTYLAQCHLSIDQLRPLKRVLSVSTDQSERAPSTHGKLYNTVNYLLNQQPSPNLLMRAPSTAILRPTIRLLATTKDDVV